MRVVLGRWGRCPETESSGMAGSERHSWPRVWKEQRSQERSVWTVFRDSLTVGDVRNGAWWERKTGQVEETLSLSSWFGAVTTCRALY